MNIVASHPDSHRHASQRSLWFGVAAGGAAWALEGFLWQIVTSQACQDGSGDWGPLSATAVAWLLGIMTLAFLGVSVAGGIVSYRNWRRLSEAPDIAHAEARGREQFMAIFGFFVSVTFIIGIVWTGLPLFLMDVCVKAR